MHPDAAELSSITTVVSDLAQRVADVAERRQQDPDDPVVGRLHEIERTLVTAARRLRTVGRDLE
jgi:ATP-dependent Clp protease ATP-binding subunit ClpA